MSKHIVVIPGDGIGTEITDAAVEVLKKIDDIYKIGLTYEWKDAGGAAYDKFGEPLPQDTIDACKKADAILFGAVGGDKWDHLEPSLRPEKAILGLRKALGLYVNLRPVKIQDSMIEYSPLKPEIAKGTDIMIVRELVGGIYFGDRCESEIHNGAERAWDLENYSVPEVDRLWRRTVTKIHDEDYPDVQLDHMYVDNCAQQFAIHPSFFDVVVTGNLFGDILSDEAAVLSGSIGMLPSASIGNETSLYEPIHGSAPDIAGKGIANPIATILSAAMLLRYSLNEDKAADAIEAAVNQALDDGYRTGDIYKEGMKKVNGRGMTDAILARIQ